VKCRRDSGHGCRYKRFTDSNVYGFLQSLIQGEPYDTSQDQSLHPRELLQKVPKRENVSIVQLNRTSAEIREVLLQSELALESKAMGIDVEPPWANGAKMFMFVSSCHFPTDFPSSNLQRYHIILKKEDLPRLEIALRALPCKRRPLLKNSEANEPTMELTWTVVKTFVHVMEPTLLTPRSSKYAASSNDRHEGHKNPRVWARSGENLPCSTEAHPSDVDSQSSLSEHMSTLRDCQKRRDFHGAIQCYSSMLRNDFELDVQVFSMLIDIAGKTGHCDDAASWMQTMLQKGITPSEVTFNCVINAYAKAKDLRKARECFEHMERIGMQPTLVAYNCVIKACVRQGSISEAEEWLKKAQIIHKPNEFSFGPFLEHFSNKGFVEKVEAWLGKKVDAGLMLNRADFGNVVSAYAKARDLAGVKRWVEKMREAGLQPEVYEYTQLINACAPCKKLSMPAQPEEARKIFQDELQNKIFPDHFNYNALAGALGHHEAQALFNQAGVDYQQLKRHYNELKEDTGISGWKSWQFDTESREFKTNNFD